MKLELMPASLSSSESQWVLTGQWQGSKGEQQLVSPLLSMTFVMADAQVAAIQTQRADYTFVVGDFILPPVAFAALLGQLVAQAAA